MVCHFCFFFFSSRRRHTRCSRDWSSDVCSSDLTHDAIELQLLDLAAKTVQPVTANGAVNVEPRWSPDGTRIAFVSSAYNRRWHIFTVAIAGGTPAIATVKM